MREQVEVLKYHTDVLSHRPHVFIIGANQFAIARHMRERFSLYINHALIDLFQCHQHTKHSGFSRAGRPNDRHHLVALHIEIK